MSARRLTRAALLALALMVLPSFADGQTHEHSAHAQTPAQKPKEPIPPVTEDDRRAAFPEGLEGHTTHDSRWQSFVLLDRLEWQGAEDGGVRLENTNWIGGDITRLWIRTDAHTSDGRVEEASVEALWGRAFSRWWDVVAGIRQDVRPGDPQTWAAVGVQGLAPYWFEVEATAYVGGSGRTQFVFETEYDLLLTNRLVLQPLVEATLAGKADPARGLGAGLTSIDLGLRLRYEIRPELAPYVGVTWERQFFGTADRARRRGEEVSSARFAIGLRTWF